MEEIKKTFTFGRNWRRFLKSYTPERQKIAQDALLAFLKLPDLKGKTFLDIGSGSGIHSAAAFLAGAERIHSFDYDPDSVAATRYLHEKMGSPKNWTIEQASVLDDDYMKSLGTFDVVYSWGVLHHTGDQWHAIKNTAICMHDQSRMFIALYAKEAYRDWQYWQDVKKRYNEYGPVRKWIMEVRYLWTHILNEEWSRILTLPQLFAEYKQSRGMAFWSDIRDWLGGWPTEFSSVPEVYAFGEEKLGLSLVNLSVGEGNSEFLFMKEFYAASLGMLPLDKARLPSYLPVLKKEMLPSFKEPVWLFGAAKGGEMIHGYLKDNGVSVAGFIDITPSKSELFGLPIFAYDDFERSVSKTTPVILASKYLVANLDRLRTSGYKNVINGHEWLIEQQVQMRMRL